MRVGVSILVIVTLMMMSCIFQFITKEDGVQFTVTSLERIVTKEGSKYLVFTERPGGNVEVFENTDSLTMFKWDSSDVQAKLKPGKTYCATVTGWRVQFLSMYRNIISIKEVTVSGV